MIRTLPIPVSMDHVNRKLIRLKEKELATLDEHAQQEREKLTREIGILRQAVHIEEETLITSKALPKGYSKQEREDLFDIRCRVMKRLLTDAQGREVHAKNLAEALNRPKSTIKDYYNEQLELRPADCFWQAGVDKAHFRWKDGYHASKYHASRVPQPAELSSPERWHTPANKNRASHGGVN